VAGKYKSNAGSVACSDCAAGKYSVLVNSSTDDTCRDCASDSYSADDRTKCVLCVNANSKIGSASISSCVCNAGWTGTNGNCIDCAVGKYKAVAGSEACSDCAAGKYSPTDTRVGCTMCAAGQRLGILASPGVCTENFQVGRGPMPWIHCIAYATDLNTARRDLGDSSKY